MSVSCERLIGTLRRELLDRLLILGEHHLHQVLTEYLRHRHRYHHARYMEGPPQVHPRSVKVGGNWRGTGQLETGLSVAGRMYATLALAAAVNRLADVQEAVANA